MNNLSQNQETSYNDNTNTNETGKYNQPGFAKKVAAIAAGLALTGIIGLGLSACGSDNVNTAPGSETTTNQSTGNNATTSANNGNTDTSAEVSKLKAAINTSGFTLDSTDSDIPQAGGTYNTAVEFTYNGKTYKGTVGTGDNKSYVVDFDSIPFNEKVDTLNGEKDYIIQHCKL